jgi:uncharacterized Fe-S cluster-containing radical SAM superfamily protein
MYPAEQDSIYNIKNTTIREWFDSEPMRLARMSMFGNKKNSFCSRCYAEESVSDTSRRHRSNQKSVIFTRTAFKESYNQSPGHHKFELAKESNGAYNGMPVDLHIDLGNYCNLACKMCNPQASSNIAVQYVKWGIESARQYIGTDWTRDRLVWDRTLEEISQIKNLKNIHFMGGETLLTKRFEDFVDFMLDKGRTDLNFSFVTNGTVFNETLMKKLLQFDRVGIEVSIETVTQHNSYQRQGTDTDIVIKNIKQYQQYCDDSRITITVRPAISLLTIGYYHTLLEYCLQQKLIVKSLICYNPKYYNPAVLPGEVKLQYIKKYQQFLVDHNLADVDCSIDYNESDPNQLPRIIKNQVLQCINILSSPRPADADSLLKEMVKQNKQWDQIYGYNARSLYPEFEDIFNQHGY